MQPIYDTSFATYRSSGSKVAMAGSEGILVVDQVDSLGEIFLYGRKT